MSIQVANISLTGAVVGTKKVITFGQSLPPPTIHQQMQPTTAAGYRLVVQNESGCGLTGTFPVSGKQLTIRAGDGRMVRIPPGESELDCIVNYVLPNAPVSSLLADLYLPGEEIDAIGTLGNSPIGVSGVTGLSTKIPIDTTAGNVVGIEFGPDAHSLSDWEFICGQNGDFLLWDNKNARTVWTGRFSDGNLSFAGVHAVTNALVQIPLDTTAGNMTTFRMGPDAHSLSDWMLISLSNGDVVLWDNKNSRNSFIAKFSDGSFQIVGAVSAIAGQATAGSFGLPPIVAQALGTHVTATTQQTIVTYTPAATGFFRVNYYINAQNATTPQTISLFIQYTDPDSNLVTNGVGFSSAAGIRAFDGVNTIATGGGNAPYSGVPLVIHAKASTAINVHYQDPGGTPNDFVTAIIEQLA